MSKTKNLKSQKKNEEKKFVVDAGFGIFTINGPNRFKETAYLNYPQELRKKLKNSGPMVVSIWGDSRNKQLNNKWNGKNKYTHVNQPSFSNVIKADHDVLLVGYSEIKDIKFWILQNSWSESWGHKGFFTIIYDENRPISDYFYTWTSIDSIKKKKDIACEIKDIKYDWTVNLDHSRFISGESYEYYNKLDKTTETGLLPLPTQESELNDFYNTLNSYPNFKNSAPIPPDLKKNLSWANSSNPYDRSIVTRTEGQYNCGSCWLFAGMSMIQSAISRHCLINYGNTFNISLSKQYICQNMHKLPVLKDRVENKLIPRHCCEGGNTQILELIVNGYKGLLSNKKGIDHDGTGVIPTALCKYKCGEYGKGDINCQNKKCENAPTFKSAGREYKEPKKKEQDSPTEQIIKKLKKIWEDYKIPIIIGFSVLVIIILYFSFKK